MGMILLGYRGSGKTTIGKKLADRLWQKSVENDDIIVKTTGKTIKEIFEQLGEQRFRDLEAEAVKKAMTMQDHVIALGGGAVLRPETRELLKNSAHKRLYLRCEPHELLRRVEADPRSATDRPDLTELGGNIDEVQRVLTEREPLYREVMTAELDVTNLSMEETVVRLVRLC